MDLKAPADLWRCSEGEPVLWLYHTSHKTKGWAVPADVAHPVQSAKSVPIQVPSCKCPRTNLHTSTFQRTMPKKGACIKAKFLLSNLCVRSFHQPPLLPSVRRVWLPSIPADTGGSNTPIFKLQQSTSEHSLLTLGYQKRAISFRVLMDLKKIY